jgi:hypothetical protein
MNNNKNFYENTGSGIFDRPNFGDLYIDKKINNNVKIKDYNFDINRNEHNNKCSV